MGLAPSITDLSTIVDFFAWACILNLHSPLLAEFLEILSRQPIVVPSPMTKLEGLLLVTAPHPHKPPCEPIGSVKYHVSLLTQHPWVY